MKNRRGIANFADGFFVRLLAVLLLTSVAVAVLLGSLLTRQSSQSLTTSTEHAVSNLATGASLRLDTWLAAREGDMALVAAIVQGDLNKPAAQAAVQRESSFLNHDFDLVEIVLPDGQVLMSTGGAGFDAKSQSWFQKSLAEPLVTPISVENNTVLWSVTAPVLATDGTAGGVVIGDLKLNRLSEVLTGFGIGGATELHLVGPNHKLIYSSEWGAITDDSTLISKGTLRIDDNNQAVTAGLAGGSGALRTTDYRGVDVISGYALVKSVSWVLIASELATAALAPIANEVLLSALVALVAVAATAVVALFVARWMARPLRDLSAAASRATAGDLTARVEPAGAREVRLVGERFNSMIQQLERLVTSLREMGSHASASATKLSNASEELAATTAEQTSAATETSASMEELARTSTSIAETLGRVSVQAQETKENLEQAQVDMQTSGTRTVALAERVNDINEILSLINEIADQTNLLALNAAIEAARAGDAGRGFAVVADEVRRLAERSKSSAARISKIIENARTESNATVMAMEQSSKQMDRGLKLLEDVVEASSHVQLITQQQRTATDQVVEAMEQIAISSRQVATTAQEISKAAASHAALATDMEKMSENGSSGNSSSGNGSSKA